MSQAVAGSLWQLVTLSNKTLLVVMYHPWPYRYQLTYHCYLLRGMPQISPLKGLFNNDPSPTLSGIYSAHLLFLLRTAPLKLISF